MVSATAPSSATEATAHVPKSAGASLQSRDMQEIFDRSNQAIAEATRSASLRLQSTIRPHLRWNPSSSLNVYDTSAPAPASGDPRSKAFASAAGTGSDEKSTASPVATIASPVSTFGDSLSWAETFVAQLTPLVDPSTSGLSEMYAWMNHPAMRGLWLDPVLAVRRDPGLWPWALLSDPDTATLMQQNTQAALAIGWNTVWAPIMASDDTPRSSATGGTAGARGWVDTLGPAGEFPPSPGGDWRWVRQQQSTDTGTQWLLGTAHHYDGVVRTTGRHQWSHVPTLVELRAPPSVSLDASASGSLDASASGSRASTTASSPTWATTHVWTLPTRQGVAVDMAVCDMPVTDDVPDSKAGTKDVGPPPLRTRSRCLVLWHNGSHDASTGEPNNDPASVRLEAWWTDTGDRDEDFQADLSALPAGSRGIRLLAVETREQVVVALQAPYPAAAMLVTLDLRTGSFLRSIHFPTDAFVVDMRRRGPAAPSPADRTSTTGVNNELDETVWVVGNRCTDWVRMHTAAFAARLGWSRPATAAAAAAVAEPPWELRLDPTVGEGGLRELSDDDGDRAVMGLGDDDKRPSAPIKEEGTVRTAVRAVLYHAESDEVWAVGHRLSSTMVRPAPARSRHGRDRTATSGAAVDGETTLWQLDGPSRTSMASGGTSKRRIALPEVGTFAHVCVASRCIVLLGQPEGRGVATLDCSRMGMVHSTPAWTLFYVSLPDAVGKEFEDASVESGLSVHPCPSAPDDNVGMGLELRLPARHPPFLFTTSTHSVVVQASTRARVLATAYPLTRTPSATDLGTDAPVSPPQT